MKKRQLIQALSVSLMSVAIMTTVMAVTQFTNIRAAINTNYTYTLNGEQILKNQPMILYKGNYYAPVAETAQALGYNALVEADKATFTSPGTVPDTKPSTNTTLKNANIAAVDFSNRTMVVYPANTSSSEKNQVVLNITPQTIITNAQGTARYRLEDIDTFSKIDVTYGATTKSIPPQANAIKIVISPKSSVQPR
ncbi:MAG: hypothetical protein ACRCSG_05120 [Cellulosilyticaceae bacterium]